MHRSTEYYHSIDMQTPAQQVEHVDMVEPHKDSDQGVKQK